MDTTLSFKQDLPSISLGLLDNLWDFLRVVKKHPIVAILRGILGFLVIKRTIKLYRSLVIKMTINVNEYCDIFLESLDSEDAKRMLIRRKDMLFRWYNTLFNAYIKSTETKLLTDKQQLKVKRTIKKVEHLLAIVAELRHERFVPRPVPCTITKSGVIDVGKENWLYWFKAFPIYVKTPIISIAVWSSFLFITGFLDIIGYRILEIRALPALIAALLLPFVLCLFFINPRYWIKKDGDTCNGVR